MEDPRKPSKAMVMKLLKVQNVDQKLWNSIRQYAMENAMQYLTTIKSDEEKQKLVDKYLVKIDYEQMATEVYAQFYTVSEILDLIAFFKTRTGQKYLQCQDSTYHALITQSCVLINRAIQSALMQLLEDMINKAKKNPPEEDDDPFAGPFDEI